MASSPSSCALSETDCKDPDHAARAGPPLRIETLFGHRLGKRPMGDHIPVAELLSCMLAQVRILVAEQVRIPAQLAPQRLARSRRGGRSTGQFL